jgi:hypothetical protein
MTPMLSPNPLGSVVSLRAREFVVGGSEPLCVAGIPVIDGVEDELDAA